MRLFSSALMMSILAVGIASAQDPAQQDTGRPDRGVARISVINGDVTILRGDSGERIAAALNAPLVVGDRLATGPGARAEIQFDSANMLRVGSDSEVRIPELEVDRFQVQIGRGTIMYRILRESRSQAEVSTPNSSIRPARIGAYRISVTDDGQTEITVRMGEVDVYTPQGAETVRAGQTMQVRGNPSDPEFQLVAANQADDWDRWNERRDQELTRSTSYRNVSPDIYGAEDLDGHGRWLSDPAYGQVWSPTVPSGWAPYQDGRWTWIDWYGWTWVGNEPWGWAPYHYGRWYMGSAGWCWYPGGGYGRSYWSPGLVAFFGFGYGGVGVGVGFGFGGLGWVPLAPFERYHPWYGKGVYSGYRNSNAWSGNGNIMHNTNLAGMYRNARVGNGVTGVSAQDFTHGRFNNHMSVSGAQIQQAGLVRGAMPLAPQRENLRVSDRAPSAAARLSASEGRFYSRAPAAPVNRVPFEQQRQSLQAGAAVARQATAARPANPAAANPANGGWRRLNEPAGRSSAAPAPVPSNNAPRSVAPQTPSPQNSPSQGGWRRFGEPSRDVPSTAYGRSASAPAPATRAVSPSMNSRPAPSNFGQSTPRSFGYPASPSRSLQVTPPVVRQRPVTPSAPAPRSFGYSGAPSRSPQAAPPAVQQRSAPSAPSGRTQSAPRASSSSQSGKSGGGHGSSGGRSSGSHSGGRSH